MPRVNDEDVLAGSRMTGQTDEYDSDMPELQSLSGESDDESEEGDIDTDPREQGPEWATELSSSSSSSSEQSEETVDVPSTRTDDVICVSTSDEEESDGVKNDTVIMEPVDSSGKTSGSNQPSDAFTTDGRGRVISVGDTLDAVPIP